MQTAAVESVFDFVSAFTKSKSEQSHDAASKSHSTQNDGIKYQKIPANFLGDRCVGCKLYKHTQRLSNVCDCEQQFRLLSRRSSGANPFAFVSSLGNNPRARDTLSHAAAHFVCVRARKALFEATRSREVGNTKLTSNECLDHLT